MNPNEGGMGYMNPNEGGMGDMNNTYGRLYGVLPCIICQICRFFTSYTQPGGWALETRIWQKRHASSHIEH